MYLPLIIGLLLALVAEPTQSPPQTHPALLSLEPLAFLLLALLAGLVTWRRTCHHCTIGDEGRALKRRFERDDRVYGHILLLAFALLVIVGHWSDLAAAIVNPEIWTLYRLLIIAPLLVALCIRWTAAYLSRRCLVNLANYRQGLQSLPPVMRSVGDYASYMGFYCRLNILTLLFPFILVLLVHDLAFNLFRLPQTDDNLQLVLMGSIFIIFLGSPLLLRFAWKTRRIILDDSPLAHRLRGVARRVGVRVSGNFRWQTAGLMGNACISGFGLPWRYVFVSDLLLDSLLPPQLEAVYGHELGHARHYHLPVYLLAGVIVMLVVFLLDTLMPAGSLPDWAVIVIQVTLSVAYWLLVLAVLSPFLERQSDLLGAASVSCPGHHDPYACPVHSPPAVTSHPVQPPATDLNLICPFQGWAFTSAMQRLAEINGIALSRRNIRHFSLQRRIDFIHAMINQPQAVARYHLAMKLAKLLMLSTALLLLLLILLLHALR